MGAMVNGLSLYKLRALRRHVPDLQPTTCPARDPTLAALMHAAQTCSSSRTTRWATWARTARPTSRWSTCASLRVIPGMTVLRPGDANEVVEAYRVVMQLRHRPAILVLSRQPLPTLDRAKYAAASGVARGAYVLAEAVGGEPELILIATGSEVSLAIAAHELLGAGGIRSRVVSMPSWDLFEQQTQEYRESVLPPAVTARIALEQASTFGWERYVGSRGKVLGMETFGASAPLKELNRHFGFEPEHVVAMAKQLLSQ
jgi:transketolase